MTNNIIIIDSNNLSRPNSNTNYKDVRSQLYVDEGNIAIIVQAYGRSNKTKNCVENLLKYTTMPFKLILIDNGSEEPDVLEYFKSVTYCNKQIVKFTKNITGVFSLNKVFKSIDDTKYIIMIPNDVIVTSNWLENMLICAESDNSIGMVVPSSSNISNLQEESLGGFSTIEEMQVKAQDFNVSNPLLWEEKIRLIPTATLYRREVFDTVGLYDVGFLHDFGDDDFTFRVRRAGYKLMLCKDTFVHHDHIHNSLTDEEKKIMDFSRDMFKNKYYGVDAWEDTDNHVFQVLDKITFSNKISKKVLGIDVKCGTPILEAKNYLRANEIPLDTAKAYVSDVKYYEDLRSITDECVCGNVEETIKLKDEKFDLIIVDEPLNRYNNPIEFIRNVVKHKHENGYVIFKIRNTNDVISFLTLLGIDINFSESMEHPPRVLDCTKVLESISDFGITKVDFNANSHIISDSFRNDIFNIIKNMDIDIDKEQMMNNWFIKDYVILVK